MKFALVALIASAAAYAVSEGPTKVDLGEADDQVVLREHDIGNGVKFSGWNNPLAWTDDGTDDENVLPQLSAQIRRGHHHHVMNKILINLAAPPRGKKDNFDGDPNTVSEYDAMRMGPNGPLELQ